MERTTKANFKELYGYYLIAHQFDTAADDWYHDMVTPFKILLVVLIGNFCEGSATCPDRPSLSQFQIAMKSTESPMATISHFIWSGTNCPGNPLCPLETVHQLRHFRLSKKARNPHHFWPFFEWLSPPSPSLLVTYGWDFLICGYIFD